MCDIAEVDGVAQLSGLECVFANIVQVVLAFGGIVLFLMLLVGGFKYITAGGNPQSLEGAKKTLTYAIGGTILLVFSFLVLVLIQEFTGVEITNFQIFRGNLMKGLPKP